MESFIFLSFKAATVRRLVDAQEFDHLRFDRARFTADLMQALQEKAAESFMETDGEVIIRQL